LALSSPKYHLKTFLSGSDKESELSWNQESRFAPLDNHQKIEFLVSERELINEQSLSYKNTNNRMKKEENEASSKKDT
jgi:hypothetical protein